MIKIQDSLRSDRTYSADIAKSVKGATEDKDREEVTVDPLPGAKHKNTHYP